MRELPANSAPRRSCRFPASVAVLIPSWNPESVLVDLARSLTELGCGTILVVDDGSDSECETIFNQLRAIPGVRLLRHARNCGKGRALKTGLGAFLADAREYVGVVTADDDGQHGVDDITRVAEALEQERRQLILGARRIDPVMPLRSRFGNGLTRYVFRSLTGVMLADTQTGLRGFPHDLVHELLDIEGERYEYEMAVLFHYCRSGHTPVEIPIQTIYSPGNQSSHFRPLTDSARVYGTLARHWLASRVPSKRAAHDRIEIEDKG